MVVDWRDMASQSVRTEKLPPQDSDFIDKFDQHKDAQFFRQVETGDSSP
jgi:hypothetical protein